MRLLAIETGRSNEIYIDAVTSLSSGFAGRFRQPFRGEICLKWKKLPEKEADVRKQATSSNVESLVKGDYGKRES